MQVLGLGDRKKWHILVTSKAVDLQILTGFGYCTVEAQKLETS